MRKSRMIAIAVGMLLGAPLAFGNTTLLKPGDAALAPAPPTDTAMVLVPAEVPSTYGGLAGLADTDSGYVYVELDGTDGLTAKVLPPGLPDASFGQASDVATPVMPEKAYGDKIGALKIALGVGSMAGEVLGSSRSEPPVSLTKVTAEKQVGPDGIVRATWATDGIGATDVTSALPG